MSSPTHPHSIQPLCLPQPSRPIFQRQSSSHRSALNQKAHPHRKNTAQYDTYLNTIPINILLIAIRKPAPSE
jgi:hypothetical protein